MRDETTSLSSRELLARNAHELTPTTSEVAIASAAGLPAALRVVSDLPPRTEVVFVGRVMQIPQVVWAHVNNDSTRSSIRHFEKMLCHFVRIIEIHSVSSLAQDSISLNGCANAAVTEMGLWESENTFNPEAGLLIMGLLNNMNICIKGRYVISQRVGRNENLLLDRSREHGFTHTYSFESVIRSMQSSEIEKSMYEVIENIRYTLSLVPVYCPNDYRQYPVSSFKIENIRCIERDENLEIFKRKQSEFQKDAKPSNFSWLFHASKTSESTESIASSNFSLSYLGSYSGNAGSYGRGIYFSTRAYYSILISSVEAHYTFFACKILQGKQKEVVQLPLEQQRIGVAVDPNYDSQISENGLEVVIPDEKQILPSFLIKFSLFGLQDRGPVAWNQLNGNTRPSRDLYSDGQKMALFN